MPQPTDPAPMILRLLAHRSDKARIELTKAQEVHARTMNEHLQSMQMVKREQNRLKTVWCRMEQDSPPNSAADLSSLLSLQATIQVNVAQLQILVNQQAASLTQAESELKRARAQWQETVARHQAAKRYLAHKQDAQETRNRQQNERESMADSRQKSWGPFGDER